MRLVLAAVLIGLTFPAAAQSAIPNEQIIEGAIEGYIQPSFQTFAEEAGSLKLNVEALCATPSEDALETARNQFKSVAVAFARVEFVRIGPLGELDRFERLLFWL